jgi:surfactin family lipopeptide synthetase A
MYRTGDIVRLRLDGRYDFLGRRDAQVKLNGQRVELDEITGAIVETGLAFQAAVVPLLHPDGSMELVAFYVPAAKAEATELIGRLRVTLPSYMVPARLVPLEEMPYTASSKIDLQALKRLAESRGGAAAPVSPPEPAPVSRPSSVPEPIREPAPAKPLFIPEPVPAAADTPEPVPVSKPAVETAPTALAPSAAAASLKAAQPAATEENLLVIWNQCLQRSDLRPDLSFFEQGGTSLAALNVLSQYHNRGLVLSLAQFYDHPTARGQAALLRAAVGAPPAMEERQASTTVHTAPRPSAPSAPHRQVFPREIPPLPARAGRAFDTVLLTGATGFLGAHMLRSLLDAGAGRVLCTMRNGGMERLLDALSWYFGSGWTANAENRLEIVGGDVGQRLLGMPRSRYDFLASRIDAIWHCAADVRHYAADGENLLRTNVAGTEAIIELAEAANAALHHMSTVSVAGTRLQGSDREAVFSEDDFDIGQNWQENIYVESKFLAEASVLSAVRRGLPARIYRLGRLVGRASDGVFQRNPETNAFYLLMRGIYVLGAVPASLATVPVEMTPIDFCAEAVVALRNSPATVYHPVNAEPPTLEQTARAVSPALTVLPDDAFDALLASRPADGQLELLAPLMDYWDQWKKAPPRIRISCEGTTAELRRIAFDSCITGPERLLRSFRFPPAGPTTRKVG